MTEESQAAQEAQSSKPSSRRKWIYGLFALFVAFVVLGFLMRKQIGGILLKWRLDPGKPFAAIPAPKAPDYAKDSAWAALPHKQDYADFNPKGTTLPKGPRKADVFFVHPTTYFNKKSWNAAIDDPKAQGRVDSAVMKHQAAAFNACCRVFAPYYRQATIYSFFALEPNGKLALKRAYDDVSRAFRRFVKHHNKGRPWILAGHSQGAMHALRLLEQHVAPNEALRKQMIAAYIVGNPVHYDRFKRGLKSVPACKEPHSTGCVVSWMTFGAKGSPKGYSKAPKYYHPKGYEEVQGKKHLCTNPISWKLEGPKVGYDKHLGAVRYKRGKVSPGAPYPKSVSGGCKDGAMFIEKPRIKQGFNRFIFGPGDYHIYDFNLFFMDIRANALLRTHSFLKAATPAPRTPAPRRTSPAPRPRQAPSKKP